MISLLRYESCVDLAERLESFLFLLHIVFLWAHFQIGLYFFFSNCFRKMITYFFLMLVILIV